MGRADKDDNQTSNAVRIWHVCSVVEDLSRAKHASPGMAIQIFEELFIGCYNEKPGLGTYLLDRVREAFAKHATP